LRLAEAYLLPPHLIGRSMEFCLRKKISLVDAEVKEPYEYPLKLPACSNQEGESRLKVLEEVKAIKERARKAKTSIAASGTFRSKGVENQESTISEGNESSSSLTHVSSPDQHADVVSENSDITVIQISAQGLFKKAENLDEDIIGTPLNSQSPYSQTKNSQSILSDSRNVHVSTNLFSISDLSLSLPELKEGSTTEVEESCSLNIHNPSPSSNLPYVKEIFRGGRNAVHLPGVGSFQESVEEILEHPDQTPIQGKHVRRIISFFVLWKFQ
jgi:hypothetical protein